MKKVFLIIVLLFLKTDTETIILKNDELLDIATFITAHNYMIDEWNVVIKEKISPKRLSKILNLLQEKNELRITENKNTRIYSVQLSNSYKKITESYRVIIPRNKQYSPEFVVSIESSQSNNDYILNYQSRLEQIVKKYFTHNASRYTCVTATSNDIINDMSFLNVIEEKLNVNNLTTQIDTINDSIHKKIIYGFTPKWDNNIRILNERLNVQIVFQSTDNGKQKIIIGTPILINEY